MRSFCIFWLTPTLKWDWNSPNYLDSVIGQIDAAVRIVRPHGPVTPAYCRQSAATGRQLPSPRSDGGQDRQQWQTREPSLSPGGRSCLVPRRLAESMTLASGWIWTSSSSRVSTAKPITRRALSHAGVRIGEGHCAWHPPGAGRQNARPRDTKKSSSCIGGRIS
jgi:hypothetical protein